MKENKHYINTLHFKIPEGTGDLNDEQRFSWQPYSNHYISALNFIRLADIRCDYFSLFAEQIVQTVKLFNFEYMLQCS